MPKYLIEGKYTQTGAQGLAREGGVSRANAVAAAAESVGGRLESFYYAFGETDAYVVLDLPDNVAAAAVALAVNGSGAVTIRTSVLLTPEEIDEATRRSVGYRPPGR